METKMRARLRLGLLILLAAMILAPLGAASARSYFVYLGQLDGESVATTCDETERCRIKLLLTLTPTEREIRVATVQFIDNEVFIFFKVNNGAYLFASPITYVADKRYAELRLDKERRARSDIHLFTRSPSLDEGILRGGGSEIASLAVRIRPTQAP